MTATRYLSSNNNNNNHRKKNNRRAMAKRRAEGDRQKGRQGTGPCTFRAASSSFPLLFLPFQWRSQHHRIDLNMDFFLSYRRFVELLFPLAASTLALRHRVPLPPSRPSPFSPNPSRVSLFSSVTTRCSYSLTVSTYPYAARFRPRRVHSTVASFSTFLPELSRAKTSWGPAPFHLSSPIERVRFVPLD